jgi:ribosomal protein S5
MTRDPAAIQTEIEQTRTELASTLDQLAEKTSPKRLAEQGKSRAVALAKSPPGLGVIGGVTALTAWLVVRRVRRGRRT